MFVTTCGRANEAVIEEALRIASKLDIPYIKRGKKSLTHHMDKNEMNCVVVGKERLELHKRDKHEEPFFFHPNSASFRIKRLMRGERDPMVDAAGLEEGMSFLDCTVGLASDSIIASHIVGPKGKVKGFEANPYIAHIISEGLKKWTSPLDELNEAMSRVEVIQQRFEEGLKECGDQSMDVVYFDPMFEEALTDSAGINPIRTWAAYTSITNEVMNEARRVAKMKIVMKNHYQSPLFEEHGFEVIKRPSSKFHFGVISV
ncbi:class I SAM-dependent methyltransferase [Rossellomorea aquimaris]|uniref:class I SAM-dependent methyltransferase n=1 Tax=Rossellomorea aquimaris TaxID=189382 RepID=UPI001CD27574|nr:class I SAM-dependent methyltransferase [Rossellomorea aquimaris]MCA1054553.1 class I SAM-dependent methyltransferase [Rossellomorea aquimaris]